MAGTDRKAVSNLFPLGIATGVAHCNREAERTRLTANVLKPRATWLSARRRMGKTSLIEQVAVDVARKRRIIVAKLDLLVVHDTRSLERRIRNAVEEAAVALLPARTRKSQQLARAFQRLKPEFTTGATPLKMTLRVPDEPQEGIEAVLEGLDVAAADNDRRVMFVLDEFQQITTLKKDAAALEGAIRHAVERSKAVAYVFAGSERHLLAEMFENKDRPLYHVCERMNLERISADSYRDFLDDAARARWQATAGPAVVERILEVTQRHPYYVNAICGRLWEARAAPTLADVNACWSRWVDEDKRRVSDRVLRLSAAQRAMLAGIARAPDGVRFPTGQAFLTEIRLATSTGLAAKSVLEDDDLIFKDEQERWRLVDPVMAAYLREV